MAVLSKPFIITPSRIKDTLLLLSALFSAFLLLFLHNSDILLLHPPTTTFTTITQSLPPPPPSLSIQQILISIASSSSSLSLRAPYLRVWHNPISHLNTTFLFLDRHLPNPPPSLPPIIVPPNSASVSSGHHIVRIVKDAVALNILGISWYVFGGDDTVFLTENLLRILSKYDHNRWYYIGCSSESYKQNEKFFFDMAYGGSGYAISASLGRVLAQVLDSCLDRYTHLYGSDARVFACLAELGVRLTVEPGFHQIDVRGNLFGMLSAHPLSLVASLHHFDAVEPIYPSMSRIQAIRHLFKAVHVNPTRILQQTVCYDRINSLIVSIAWGYAIQVYEGNQLLPELLSLQRSFRPWKRGKNLWIMMEYGPTILDIVGNCARANKIQKLRFVSVLLSNLDMDMDEIKAPRRDCCDISSSFDTKMNIRIRKCGIDELIAMRG